MPKSRKEFTKITALIKHIINAYPGNWAILREYLQNADDSGATEQIFILDERSYRTGSLVDPVLKRAQGPALIAINNGIITNRDWEALLKIHSSSKQEDETQTGKNGLGFRASYHLTENPHILSGRALMILDPHNEFTAHPGGVSIDLIDEGEQYEDQLLPFTSCIDGMTFPYDGTVFRLPLRTEEQAQKSDIKPTPTSVNDILEVLVEFSTRELEEAILFLKHIRAIQIFHINSSKDKVSLAKVTIDPPLPSPCPPNLIRRTTVTSANGKVTSRDWKFHYFSQTNAVVKAVMKKRLKYNIGNRLTQDKLSPIVNIAFPLDGSSVRGRLFTLLPLPQYTDFPIHLNAVFALDPSRQNLKNILEVGAANSRERLLVEWNKIIFDTWTPTIWVDLLADLSDEVLISTKWNLWPPQENGEDCYWSGLTAAFTNGVVSRYLRVFSTVPGNTAISRVVRITDPDVLLASANPQISLSLLSDLGVSIIQPPYHIYAALLAGKRGVTLSPETLHRVLLRKAHSQYEGYRDSDLKTVMDYLVFSSGSTKLKNIAGLPWVRRAKDNLRVSLNQAGSGGIKFLIPQTEVEVTIFFENTAMLAWDAFSDRLLAELSQHAAPGVLNVGTVNPTDVVSFLKHRLVNLQSTSDEILNVPSECDYLIAFWTWIVGWSKGDVFFQSHLAEVSSLFLLPTSRRSLRRFSSGIIHFGASETQFVDAWENLKIYSLASDVPHNVISKLRAADVIPVPRSWTQILFLINNADIASSSKSENIFEDIRRYLSENLPRALGCFTAEQKAKFKQFPIFTVKDVQSGDSSLGTIDGHCIYVQVEQGVPLPRLQKYPNAIYVDVKDSTTLSFAGLVENEVRIQNEFSVLQLVIDNWDVQADGNQDKFIDRIFQYRPDRLPPSLRQSLTNLKFVVVNDSTERKKPRDLIHPVSSLKNLYLGEAGRMPAGRFGDAKLLAVMQEYGFLRSSLDAYVVRDRISYIINPSNASDGRLIQKAVAFVDLLNHEWKSDYTHIIQKYRSKKWIPCGSDGPTPTLLVSPSESRDNHRDDHNHPYLFDKVLKHLCTPTFRSEFRVALRWSTIIPLEILIAQLTATLDDPANRIKRLTKLLTYFNRLLSSNDLNSSALKKLRSAVNGRAWIPSNSSSEHLMETRYALLLEPSRLNDPFHLVHIELLNSLPILRSLGCCDRPPLDVLVAELNKQYNDKSSSRTMSMSLKIEPVLAILQEIVDRHYDRLLDSGINIPGNDGHGHPLSDVYLSDSAVPLNLPASLQGKFAAHNGISSSLAQSLGIPLLSSLTLGDDPEEDDDEQMDIDFVTVVRQFLSDYDPQYALNEFLANANDARATTFSILLDQQRDSPVGNLIKPNFKILFSCETLFFHNDSQLTQNDFKGIRRVGRGSKLGDVDTHGRHGLGALSLYYFTDVATIISGEYVLILDPSNKYLPPFSNGRRRTATFKRISEILSQYPGQLERCESKFGFSSQNPRYDGTIFFLPLNASITEKACNLVRTMGHLENSYRQLASRTLLFTNLERITADQLVRGNQSTIWAFSAQRSPDKHLGTQFEYHTLTISEDRTNTVTTWIVATSKTGVIPKKFIKIAQVLKLTQSVKVELAINRKDVENNVFQGYPFSTVSLPRGISLPFHMNARFAISSNRQDLVLNPGDSGGNNDGHTSFNTWILKTLVPPLYLEALCFLISQSAGQLNSKNWFFPQCSDVTSQITRSAFFQALPESNHAIFVDVSGHLVSFSEAVFSKGEPKEVMEYLTKMKIPTYVKSCQYNDIAKIDGSTLVGPSFVRGIFHTNADAFLRSHSLTPEICFPIFNYLAQESTLIGLPLLVLQSGDIIAVPDASGTPVYHCETPGHTRLFSSSQFMAIGSYSPALVNRLLSDTSINVASLTQGNVVHLIAAELQTKSKQRRTRWAHNFWKHYPETLPGPLSIASLESADLSLVEATQGASSSLLPLNQCRPDTVVYNTGLEDGLVNILHTLRIETITDEDNRLLKAFLKDRFKKDILSNVLLCIDAKGIDTLSSLNPPSLNSLSGWIQTHIRQALDLWTRDALSMPLNKSILMRFTIWDVYSNGGLRSGHSMNLSVLPSHLKIHDIAPYLKPNITVAPWSSLLLKFLELCSSRTRSSIIFTPAEILSIVALPATVTSGPEVANLKTFLTSMFKYSDQALKLCSWSVPDCDGTLMPVEDLYDDSIGLFRSTLRFTQRPSFLHDDFKCYTSQLRKLGLVHEITIENFLHCANAVSEAYRTHGEMWNIVRQMSQDAFSVYQSQIPALTLLRGSYLAWSSVDDISFVLRKTERRQGATYHIRDNYVARPLPSILPPSSFVLPAYEAVAWTQRALFLTEPIDGLITVNKTLGIPTAEEVVAHLVLLTTVIAIDHPGDRTLLSDIKATYAWLNENAASAGLYFRQSESKKLFLNVDDPTDELWSKSWASAEELVLKLEYDQGPLKIVRKFLKDYDALLRAAGCADIEAVGQAQKDSMLSDTSSARTWRIDSEFDKMRQKNELTDITLVPTLDLSSTSGTDEIDDSASQTLVDDDIAFTPFSPGTIRSEVTDRSDMYSYAGGTRRIETDFRAHRVVMAAAIPHLRGHELWKQNTQHDGMVEITFYGSAFAAKAVLDFVYTGEIEFSAVTTNKLELTHLMHDLLKVLPVAEEWNMQDLKQKIQWEIVSKHEIVRRLPNEYDTLLYYATMYNADQLLAALKELEPIRARIQRLMESEKH